MGGRQRTPNHAPPQGGAAATAQPVEFLAIGHLTLDVTPEPGLPHGRVRPGGGAAAYAALTATALGLRAAVVTSVGPGYPLDSALPGVPVRVVPSPQTTFFQNIYPAGGGGRRQVLGARAAGIEQAHVPPAWLQAPIVFLGPLVRELPPDAPDWFAASHVGAGVQGWLRRWDAYGHVTAGPRPPRDLSRGLRLVAGAAAELGGDRASEWAAFADVVGLTRGNRGSRVLAAGRWRDVPAYAAREVDPTGAGDVWAAACLIHLVESGDPLAAARFANAAASLSVEAEGLAGIPARSAVEERLRRGP